MSNDISLVQQVRIASPCQEPWENMTGNERVRFCGRCKLNVYNLSEMSQAQGWQLILDKEGKLCARIFRRVDGTILTRDCPIGVAALRRTRLALAKVAALALFVLGGFAFARWEPQRSWRRWSLASMEPIASIQRWLDPNPAPRGQWTGGVILGRAELPAQQSASGQSLKVNLDAIRRRVQLQNDGKSESSQVPKP